MARPRQSVGTVTFPGSRLIVDPTPEQVRRDLLLLQRNIKGYEPVLQLSKQDLIEDVKNAFESETDPVSGQHWKALSARAQLEPRFGILQRTKTNRRMYRAVTGASRWGISKQGVFLNTRSVLRMAPYAPLHQQDDKLPAVGLRGLSQAKLNSLVLAERKRLMTAGFGTHFRSNAERASRIKEVAASNVKANLEEEAAAGHTLPQRRFIGPSEYTQGLIRKHFDRWASNAIIIYKRGGKMIAARRTIR